MSPVDCGVLSSHPIQGLNMKGKEANTHIVPEGKWTVNSTEQ